jgi:hypothetical protein
MQQAFECKRKMAAELRAARTIRYMPGLPCLQQLGRA